MASSFAAKAETTIKLPNWQTVGTAKLTVFLFDIYLAELLSEDGNYQEDGSFILTLTYLRDFDADELIDETFNQFRKPPTDTQAILWRERLQQLWPNVKKGDQISFLKMKNGESHFFFNNNYRGNLIEPEFAQSFAAIWLSDDSEYPKLAAKLKGK